MESTLFLEERIELSEFGTFIIKSRFKPSWGIEILSLEYNSTKKTINSTPLVTTDLLKFGILGK
jgi:hypothetical protein